MLKRTNSFILLTLLVLTGLAGKDHAETLTRKERRILNRELKGSRTDLINSIEGLSEKQINFHLLGETRSIATCLYQMADQEASLWSATQSILSAPAPLGNSINKAPINIPTGKNVLSSLPSLSENYTSIDAAIERFLSHRASIVRYVQTTTDDVRTYLITTPSGTYDVYQLMRLNAECSRNWATEINRIKSGVLFPKR